jgi:hypothetical protein
VPQHRDGLQVKRIATRRMWWGVLALILLAGCDIGGGTSSRSAAANGYGSGAVEMVFAHLRPDVQPSVGSALSQQWIGRQGVVFTNWTPIDGLIIGVGDRSAVAGIEAQLRADSAVESVTDGPPPTAPPAGPGK